MIDTICVGKQGLTSSLLGLGCMGMSEFYVGSVTTESAATLQAAVASGVTMFDTADMYGPFTNEEFVGRCLKPYRAQVTLATKFGYVRKSDGTRLGLNGRPEYVRYACDESLRRLDSDYIDLYYLHRVDRTVPIEDTVGAMAELVKSGKVRFIGLSEVTASTLRRAHAVAPISAVQTEFSLLSRSPESDLFPTLDELGIGFVAYAPLARGLLTGRFRRTTDIPVADYRRTTPRFWTDNLAHNMSLVAEVEKIALRLGCSAAQVALAWVREKIGGRGVVLVGTANRKRLGENLIAIRARLAPEDIVELDATFHPGAARGSRYPDMSRVDG